MSIRSLYNVQKLAYKQAFVWGSWQTNHDRENCGGKKPASGAKRDSIAEPFVNIFHARRL